MNDHYSSNFVRENEQQNDMMMTLNDNNESYMKLFKNCLKKKS